MFLFHTLLPSLLKMFFDLFRGERSPQQHGYHKLKVPPYVRLSYPDNMFRGQVPAHRSSLQLDKEWPTLNHKRGITFCAKKQSKFGVYFRQWAVMSDGTCMCSGRVCVWMDESVRGCCMQNCEQSLKISDLVVVSQWRRRPLPSVFIPDLAEGRWWICVILTCCVSYLLAVNIDLVHRNLLQ